MPDKFVDIAMIAATARQMHADAYAFVPIDEIRRDAIHKVAEDQFRGGRYKSLESAEKTLHDACVKRLKPEVNSIEEFDALLEKWIRKGSTDLADALKRKATHPAQRELIRVFFEKG